MRKTIYFDTSALAKWYLNEARSNDVEKYIQEHGPVDISELTVVEMRSLLARRRRERHIDPKTEIKVFATFEEDIRQKFLILHPLPEGLVTGAVNLLSVHSEVPLKTLDALHLVMAKEIQAEILATADRIMIAGAKAMGFSVAGFD
jgi:predicted nucleic acid-binding protein